MRGYLLSDEQAVGFLSGILHTVVRQDKSKPGRITEKKVGPSGVSRDPVQVGGRFAHLVPVLMFTLMGMGLILILANYVVTGLGAPSNWYLLGGLALILGGIVAATQYH